MECTILTLIACFSWSNFYVTGGLAYEDVKYYEIDMRSNTAVAVSNNPIGELGFGFEAPITNHVSIDMRLWSHRSSLSSSNDRGVNSAMLQIYWRPFSH